MQNHCYLLSYWGQISVIIRVMFAGLLLLSYSMGPDFCYHKSYYAESLLPIELLGPDFCYHKSYYAESLLPIELLGPDFCYHKSYVCRIAVTH